uniref:Uncharacterized protein n=1 Tax=Arundo donax TaxID=35708 RepID=A0A0A9E5V6_ARUDO
MVMSLHATPLRGAAEAATPGSSTASRRRLIVPSARRVASVRYPAASTESRVRHVIGGATLTFAGAGAGAASPMLRVCRENSWGARGSGVLESSSVRIR